MSAWPTSPTVYEINTWIWLNELSSSIGKRVTLGTVPKAEVLRLSRFGFDAIWLMGVWERSRQARQVALEAEWLRKDRARLLPLGTKDDVCGSPYALLSYHVDPHLGDDEELVALRARFAEAGLRLMLDFVPNHMARDHVWTRSEPDRLVRGKPADIEQNPAAYFTAGSPENPLMFAHGRGRPAEVWDDTVQLDYRCAATRDAMQESLTLIAEKCDGVRCDMAMLVTHDDFIHNWGGRFDAGRTEFWEEAIPQARVTNPHFLMLAEVYWDREQELLRQGFDFAYCKKIYDHLQSHRTDAVVRMLRERPQDQARCAHFVENHDEPRALEIFGSEYGRAAATVTFMLPGLRLLHDGQLEGRRQKVPVQLGRRPHEPRVPQMQQFYRGLLGALGAPVMREGRWKPLRPREFVAGDSSFSNVVAFSWVSEGAWRIVAVNLSSSSARCLLPLNVPDSSDRIWCLSDRLGTERLFVEAAELRGNGLRLDMSAHVPHVFDLRPTESRLVQVLRDQNDPVYDLAWSPDGRFLAFAGTERSISVWDAETDGMRRFEWHLDTVGALSWHPAGQILASGCHDTKVRLWNLSDSRLIRVLEGHGNGVLTIDWSPRGDALASGAMDQYTHIWNTDDGELLCKLAGHTHSVNCVRWSPSGDRLVTASGDGTAWMWSTADWEPVRIFRGPTWLSHVAWSPDGSTLAFGSGDGTIDVRDAESGSLLSTLRAHTERVLALAFTADSQLLCSKAADGTVRLWQSGSWTEIGLVRQTGLYLSGLAAHPSQLTLALRDDRDNSIRIWHLGDDIGSGITCGSRCP